MPDLDLIWRAYLHRFDVEHGYRFAKTALGWDKATLREPDQVSRWTWLILCGLTQLRLARPSRGSRQRWERRASRDATRTRAAIWPPGRLKEKRKEKRRGKRETNSIRLKTARSARSRPNSAACSAVSACSRAFSSRSSAARRAISSFTARAAASTSRSDASASSESGTTPTAAVTLCSKHLSNRKSCTTHHAFRIRGVRGCQRLVTRLPNTYVSRAGRHGSHESKKGFQGPDPVPPEGLPAEY